MYYVANNRFSIGVACCVLFCAATSGAYAADNAEGNWGKDTDVRIHLLISKFDKKHKRKVREQAFREIVLIGRPAVPALIDAWMHGDYATHRAAGAAMLEIGPQAVPFLIDELRNESSKDHHHNYIHLLGFFGEDAKPAVPLLCKLVRHDGRISGDATGALARIGPAAKDSLPELMDTLKSKKAHVRNNVACIAPIIAPDGKQVTPHLLAALKKEKEPANRRVMAVSLIAVGCPLPLPRAVVAEHLTDDSPEVRKQTLGLLEENGKLVACTLPDIRTMLKTEKDAEVRKYADHAIKAIQFEEDTRSFHSDYYSDWIH